MIDIYRQNTIKTSDIKSFLNRNNIECRDLEADAVLRRINLRDGKEVKYRDWKSFFNRDYYY
jgi:hypothetical protein